MKINLQTTLPKQSDSILVLVFNIKNLKPDVAHLGIETNLTALKNHLKEHGDVISTLDKKGKIVFMRMDDTKCHADQCKTLRQLIIKNRSLLGGNITVVLPDLSDQDIVNSGRSIVNAAYLSTNNLGKYKYKPNGLPKLEELTLVTRSLNSNLEDAINEEVSLTKVQLAMMDLINTPSNIKTPEYIADLAGQSGKKHGFKVDIFTEKEIKKNKLAALQSVSDGSANPPRFLILHYKPKNKEVKTLGLVGKGVTFDTGGVSMKSSTNMHFMKSDMSGAALVLGFTELCARLALPIEVYTTIPLTENVTDGSSTKPGDVIGSYIGKSIEVIDTDAEGRLILADGLGYLTKNFKTDVLLDFATLTGSVIQTLGYQVAGLFSNNDDLADQIYNSGKRSGDKCWRLPNWEDYQDELKSDIADVKNFSGKPIAGAITAALFLKEFIGDHSSWAHIDIAGVSFSDNEYGTMRNATGYGLQLLLDFVKVNMVGQ